MDISQIKSSLKAILPEVYRMLILLGVRPSKNGQTMI